MSNYQLGDVLYMPNGDNFDVYLARIYHHTDAKADNYHKTSLNWHQKYPTHFNTVWGCTIKKFEFVAPSLFIVDSILPGGDYILLMNYQAIANHPKLNPQMLEATRNQEIYLLNILRHYNKSRKDKTDSLFIRVKPSEIYRFQRQLSSVGDQGNHNYMIWDKNYDAWFNWSVNISFKSKDQTEPQIQAALIREAHIYKDCQGLTIQIRSNNEEIATIQVHQRPDSDNFDKPVIKTASDLAHWQIQGTLNLTTRILQIEIRQQDQIVLA